ncbi:MAG: helix-turn-helix domain-containing protein [Streptosporangiaceae bacterium]
MGRPQEPLDRDGSPIREFAFWLRDLRNRSGLTYEELGKKAHYATSTVQAAAAGQRLATRQVVMAFVLACGGDARAWGEYWTKIRRLLDQDVPDAVSKSVMPPWAEDLERGEPAASGGGGGDEQADGVLDGWYSKSCVALLRLDTEPIESLEQRVIVAAMNGVSELATSISVPRHPDDSGQAHNLEVEVLYGGSLEKREQPFESYFRNFIALPKPLHAGEHHEYAMRVRIPPQQQMLPHYVQMPLRRTDYFEARVRFSPAHMPREVWTLDGAPPAALYGRDPAHKMLVPDRFGEVYVSFNDLKLGLSYGVCWLA